MKILFLYAKGNSEILNRQSALGSYMHCLCELLVKNNYSIQFNDVSFEELTKNNNTLVVNPATGKKKRFIPVGVKNMLKDFSKLWKIRKIRKSIIRKEFEPDVIIEFYNYGSSLGLRLTDFYRVPLIVVYDAPVQEEYEFFNGKNQLLSGLIRKLETKTLQKAESIVVYSNSVKNYLKNKLKNNNKRFYIHQNVDFTRFQFLKPKEYSKEMNIGFIGSFLKWHRVDLLLQAFDKLDFGDVSVKLYLVGSGMELPNIQKMIDGLNRKDRIVLTGFLDGDELFALKSKLHIGIMPGSNWYGAPNKIFEYGAAGMVVVAPSTPTICDLFVAENELLIFKWDDLNDLQRNIQRLLKEPKLYNDLANSLHEKIKSNYSERATFEFYHGLISETKNSKS